MYYKIKENALDLDIGEEAQPKDFTFVTHSWVLPTNNNEIRIRIHVRKKQDEKLVMKNVHMNMKFDKMVAHDLSLSGWCVGDVDFHDHDGDCVPCEAGTFSQQARDIARIVAQENVCTTLDAPALIDAHKKTCKIHVFHNIYTSKLKVLQNIIINSEKVH